MSVKLSAYVWDGCASSGMKTMKVAIMVRLADFSNDEGVCWPSVDTIARQIGAGRSTVITAINELMKEGWLTKQERRKGQRSATNIYRLNVEKLRTAANAIYSQGSDSGRSESEHSETGHSESERSGNIKKSVSQGPESGHDPSVSSKQDPSVKTSCPAAEQPDPATMITDQAKQVLNHLNLVTGSKYQPSKTSLEGIRARLIEGFTLSELLLVVDYTNEKWGDDLKMSEYLRPIPLFSPSKFPGYLQAAEKWNESGRPEYVNGKWVKDGKPIKGSGVDNSERDAAYRRYTSGVGEITNPSQLEIEVRKAAGKAGIRNQQASFAQQRWNSLWTEYSERLSGEAAA
ncbi:conserved phage C-terminal domain-containing protein [Limnobaculum xujianqingii]|uniref:conserved phage C-terminal domain-containing protein n=1 Tax=Limnobaculum xujianqingii TaxID=2738837 RepID=UPI00112911E2|nr:conserved phage C-terminal domain-containing protein [Limnobaculum xujianqingii]